MALSVTNNAGALYAQHSLNQAQSSLNASLQRLSAGLKLSTDAHGPPDKAIGGSDESQFTGLDAAISKGATAADVVQTGADALNQLSSMLASLGISTEGVAPAPHVSTSTAISAYASAGMY
jgi:flagellin